MPTPPDDRPVVQKIRLVEQLRSGEARRLREQVGVTQDELAGWLRASRASVIRWEAGRYVPRDARVVNRWTTLLTAMRNMLAQDPAATARPTATHRTTQNPDSPAQAAQAASLPDESAEGTGDHQR